MNEQLLKNKANEFLNEHFGMNLDIPLRISNRMKSTFGVFYYHDNRRTGERYPKEIAMSAEMIRNHSIGTVLDVLYHECVHYALFVQGKPHGDGDQCFKDTVDRLGVSRTRTYRYKGKAYKYECKECGRTAVKKMKGFEKRYCCGKCRGRFRNAGTVEIAG